MTLPGAPVASIDDLLGLGEEPAPEHGDAPSPVGRWIKNVLIVAVATAALIGALRIAGVQVNPFLALAAVLALRVLQRAVVAVAPPPPVDGQRRTSDEDGNYRFQATDGLRTVVRRWEQQLTWAQSDAERFSRNVLPVLAELTDERLRLQHGITRATEPHRARELLGDPLWQLLADPARRPPKPRDLAAHVQALENL